MILWEKQSGKDAWVRADGKIAASYDDEQSVDGRNLSEAKAEAARMTHALVFIDVAFALAASKRFEIEKQRAEFERKQLEASGVAAAFGPVPSAPPVTTSTPVQRLHFPHPAYPYQARAAHLTGSGFASASFDETGHCSSVTITQSCGSGMLDNNTVDFGESNWTGIPNTTARVPATYKLQ